MWARLPSLGLVVPALGGVQQRRRRAAGGVQRPDREPGRPAARGLLRGVRRQRSTSATATRPTWPCSSTRRATARPPTCSSRRAPVRWATSMPPDASAPLPAEVDRPGARGRRRGRCRLGGAVGPGAHAGLQHRPRRPGRPARLGARPHGARVRGPGGAGPHQRLVPGLRDGAAPRARRRRGPGVARRHGGGRPADVRQQHRHRRGRGPGRGADGPGQPLLRLPGQAEDPDLPVENHFFPDGDYGSTLLVTAASIVDGTDKRDDAEELVEFLLSDEAQTVLQRRDLRVPAGRRRRRPTPELPPFEEISKTRVDLDELGGGLEATTAMIDESGLNR